MDERAEPEEGVTDQGGPAAPRPEPEAQRLRRWLEEAWRHGEVDDDAEELGDIARPHARRPRPSDRLTPER